MESYTDSRKGMAMNILRWAIALPAAFLSGWAAFILMRILGRFSLNSVGVSADSFWSQLYETTIAHGVMGGIFVYVGGYVVPHYKITSSMVFGGIALASAGFLAFPAVLVNDWWAMFGASSICVGAGIMVWSLHSGEINFD